MAFGRIYNVELPDGAALNLRRPTTEEFDRLLPVPEEVFRFNPLGATGAGGCEFPHSETGEDMVSCLGSKATRYLKTRAWGIEYNGALVGAAGVDHDPDIPYPSYFIDILDPRAWGKGIGTAVTALVAYDTFSLGFSAVASGSHPGNQASQKMHSRVGYVLTQEGHDPDDRIRGRYDEFVLPAPSGPKPTELTQEQTDTARRVYAEQLGTLVFRRPKRVTL